MSEIASKEAQTFARLLPLNERKGRLVGRYSHWDSRLYVGGKKPTWYQVTDAQAAELRPLRQEGPAFDDPDAKPLFEIVNGSRRSASRRRRAERRCKPSEWPRSPS